jgi:hypothetical protein
VCLVFDGTNQMQIIMKLQKNKNTEYLQFLYIFLVVAGLWWLVMNVANEEKETRTNERANKKIMRSQQ